MARKKRSRIRYVTRKAKRSYRKRSSGSFNIKNLLLPIGVATVAEPIIDRYAQMLPVPKIANLETDDMVKVAIGYYLGKKGGMMGNTAKMLGIFGLRNLVSQGLGNVLGGQTQDPWAASQGF